MYREVGASVAEAWLMGMAGAVAAELASGRVADKSSLQKAKHRAARAVGAPRIPGDAELLPLLGPDEQARWSLLLRKKPMRSQSGVAIVAVMSSPAACPHGKCVYCPGGPDAGVPQSYTGFEPSTMRAMRMDYDAYRVVRSRLGQLERNGHPVDKVEVVVQGGTFPARDPVYQDHFIGSIFAACNDGPVLEGGLAGDADADSGPDGRGSTHRPLGTTEQAASGTQGRSALTGAGPDAAAWSGWTEAQRTEALAALQHRNETAACRIVGLTVETKPDWCLGPHIDTMLRHGATRIELGIQTLDEEVTRLTNRGHTVEDARQAMQAARDAGFKVCVHMMPGLPRPAGSQDHGRVGALIGTRIERGLPMAGPGTHNVRRFVVDPAADVEDMRLLFEDPAFRPDMLKIYPTLVVQEGETVLKRWWREGRFVPMDTAQAVDVVAESLRHVPEYCRIQRIDRDIPTTHVLAGVMHSNLRQLAEEEAVRRGIRLRDIRAREVGTRTRAGVAVDPERLELVTRTYEASGGTEAFLSLEDPVADAVAGFVRVRRVGAPQRDELANAAVVRELKVYGAAQRLGEHDPSAWQHRGHGARLLHAAEAVAWDWGVGRLAVLAGAGVKGYYRRHGYSDLGPYVAKVAP